MKTKTIWTASVCALYTVALAATGAWAGQLQIKGSTTVLPIAQKVADPFMKAHPDVKLSISGGGSGNGIKALIDKATDIAMASRAMKDKEVALAKEKGVEPMAHEIAYDCIVPVVHPDNPVTDISMDQLKEIYMGKVTNWKDLGGPDMEVVVISRDTSSGTYEVWESKVMDKERVYPGALLQASNGAVVQAVSKNKNAIGYIGYGYMDESTKGLTVNGIEGKPETALNGEYPVSRALYLYTQGESEGDVKSFIDFVLSADGQALVKEAGFVPLK